MSIWILRSKVGPVDVEEEGEEVLDVEKEGGFRGKKRMSLWIMKIRVGGSGREEQGDKVIEKQQLGWK